MMLVKLKLGIIIVVIFDWQEINVESAGLDILTHQIKNKNKQMPPHHLSQEVACWNCVTIVTFQA